MGDALEALRESSRMCFACGEDNPIGLKLRFNAREGSSEATFKLSELYQGYNNIAHGGIITTVLDEAMVYAISSKGYRRALTTELKVIFHRPLRIGKEYEVRAEVTWDDGSWARARAVITSINGTLIAEAESKFKVSR